MNIEDIDSTKSDIGKNLLKKVKQNTFFANQNTVMDSLIQTNHIPVANIPFLI